MKALYMFVSPVADYTKHKAVIETPKSKIIVIGVKSIEEAAKIAEQLVCEGVELIELCGGFGYEGAKRINKQVGDRIPVGMVVHQVWNSSKLAKLLGS